MENLGHSLRRSRPEDKGPARSFTELPVEVRERIRRDVQPADPEIWVRQPLAVLGDHSFLDTFNGPNGLNAVNAYLQRVGEFERSLVGPEAVGVISSGSAVAANVRLPIATRVALVVTLAVIAAIFGGLGGYLVAESQVLLPREYDRLSAAGVPVTGTVTACHGGKTAACYIGYVYAGRSWFKVYVQDRGQFGAIGSTVDLLIDPNDPSAAFTEKDVRTRYRDPLELPFGLVSLFAAGVMIVAGIIGTRRGSNPNSVQSR